MWTMYRKLLLFARLGTARSALAQARGFGLGPGLGNFKFSTQASLCEPSFGVAFGIFLKHDRKFEILPRALRAKFWHTAMLRALARARARACARALT